MSKDKPLAALDSSSIIDLLGSPEDPRFDQTRHSVTDEHVAELQKTHRIAIPAVALAELGQGEPSSVFRAIVDSIPSLLILALDEEAALIAGPMRKTAFETKGANRRAITYDALICATAVAHGVERIVTANGSHFRKLLDGYPVEVCVPHEPPTVPGTQLKLVHQKKSGS